MDVCGWSSIDVHLSLSQLTDTLGAVVGALARELELPEGDTRQLWISSGWGTHKGSKEPGEDVAAEEQAGTGVRAAHDTHIPVQSVLTPKMTQVPGIQAARPIRERVGRSIMSILTVTNLADGLNALTAMLGSDVATTTHCATV